MRNLKSTIYENKAVAIVVELMPELIQCGQFLHRAMCIDTYRIDGWMDRR